MQFAATVDEFESGTGAIAGLLTFTPHLVSSNRLSQFNGIDQAGERSHVMTSREVSDKRRWRVFAMRR
jgi:hypothetical protein